MTGEVIEVAASIGATIIVCPHCGAALRIDIDADHLIQDVTNIATTATNLVNASNIIRKLLQSGLVPPEVLEDVQRAEASLVTAATHLTGGME